MKKIATYRIVPAVLAVFTMGLASVQAAPIFTDDFSTAGTGAWYKGGETAGSLTNAGGALVFNSGTVNGQDVVARSFSATTLDVGQTMRLTFDYKIDAEEGKIFRAGLYDTANEITANGFTDAGNAAVLGDYDGYYTFLRDNSASANAARFQDETMPYQTQYWPTSGGTSIGSATTQYDMLNGTQYSVVFDVTKTSATQTDTLLTFNSADGSTTHMSLAGSTTTLIQNSFDAVFIRTGTSDATIDNVSVEVLGEAIGPEPPVWNEVPVEMSGFVGVDFSDTLAGKAIDPNLDTITYSRDSSGPSWLSVADTGELTGVPDSLGTDVFKVVAYDGNTTPVTNTLNIVCLEATPADILIDTTTRNGSFEDGGTEKLYFKDGTVNSWQTWAGVSSADNDTGASVPASPLPDMDGTRRAFFQPGGAVLNMTDYVIQEGDVIDYSLWNLDVGRTARVEVSLVWDNGGSMDVIPGTGLLIDKGTQGVGTPFTVQAGDAWIGKTLGLGIADDGTDGSSTTHNWPGVDQAYLKVVAEVSDPVTDLVISSPINNGTQMVLSWTGESGGSYSVQTNSNLTIAGGWKDWMTGIDGIGTLLNVTNDIGPDQLFYQVITE